MTPDIDLVSHTDNVTDDKLVKVKHVVNKPSLVEDTNVLANHSNPDKVFAGNKEVTYVQDEKTVHEEEKRDMIGLLSVNDSMTGKTTVDNIPSSLPCDDIANTTVANKVDDLIDGVYDKAITEDVTADTINRGSNKKRKRNKFFTERKRRPENHPLWRKCYMSHSYVI